MNKVDRIIELIELYYHSDDDVMGDGRRHSLEHQLAEILGPEAEEELSDRLANENECR